MDGYVHHIFQHLKSDPTIFSPSLGNLFLHYLHCKGKQQHQKNRNNVWLLWIGSKRDRYIVIKKERQKIKSSKRKILTAMHCISMPEEKATGNVTFSFLVWTSLFIDSAWQFVIVLSFGRIVLSRLSSSFQKRISVFLFWLSKFNPMNPRGKSTELSSDIDPICWNSAKESNLPLLNFIGKKKSLIERTRANWIHSVHKS